MFRWSNEQLRAHAAVLDGIKVPHIVLQNATYLNSYLHEWVVANIWIYEDRIVYVGEKLPAQLAKCEVIDCTHRYVVPGYIDPHVHPCQVYNPETFAYYAGRFGTTTLINDNLAFYVELPTEQALELLDDCQRLPTSMYWWCRFDAQTELPNNAELFHAEAISAWLRHEAVLQGGELTAWPRLVEGDDELLTWMQEARALHKKVEGHFPGASERTLAKLMLLGADCDHEAMTGAEALMRLQQGYYVTLRDSSIRPDLDVLLQELLALGLRKFDRLFMTTDGSHPYFYARGVSDVLVKKAIAHGVLLIDAYHMVSYNVASYYNMQHVHGSIATGRIANLNILAAKDNPTPVSVLAKGQWLLRECEPVAPAVHIDWDRYGFSPLQLDWSVSPADLHYTATTGIHLLNNVIAKPYETTLALDVDVLEAGQDECFLTMIARDGSWQVNTVVKGFASQLDGFASSYSGPGDILLIGKNKQAMCAAFQRMKELGGGIVLVEDGQVLHETQLPLLGRMSDLALEELIPLEQQMIDLLKARGYAYEDPAFTLFFFAATHLPFVRLTPRGLFDVKNKEVLVAPIAR